MFLTVVSSSIAMLVSSWFVYRYRHEDRPFSNEELAVMSRKLMAENKDLHRARKTVLTAAELQRLDPTFIPPYIPTYGEPDI